MQNPPAPSSVDTLYDKEHADLEDFKFNAQVVDVFPDMINRSVPGYGAIVDGIGKLSAKFLQDGSTAYDLGCSLGAVCLSIAKHSTASKVHIIGIDNSQAMVARCKSHVNSYKHNARISINEADILQLTLQKCSVVVMNFTLQFIEQSKREQLIKSIYNALEPGGIFIVSEKIKLANETMNAAIIDLHHDFKRDNGYSDLEISQKRSALESVMILDEFSTHEQRLKSAGFKEVSIWYQQFNFASFFAIKE
ncbi:carboxy-S-adenosyl-L-methionine synthase CmoA [Glaciecola sp. MH2013]|uniref:carboxy-S-adenosyl-L-methionine synthase CmoA n=1 Tax=Glaciecola sp. MH2013 TaxID=2785524 RepID=UPI00189D9B33|nr:carboxy-S-adenosyl-L-methionine synthase CmoA [Glaciecola sp. MH2013]MBF7072889.1 carboxy-S-adenosyl-L-methionine synthase CmoA [Glaciecola sp. MH2013]